MNRSLPALRDLTDRFYDLGEVRSLCFSLGQDYDNLAGETKQAKIESLLNHLERRGRLGELIALLEEECPEIPWQIGPPGGQPNPYRGLAAFREEDADLFFGREAFSQRLFDAVGDQRLVAIIGSSGSGKSSAVFDGLLPKVRRQGEWDVASFRTGPRPFRSSAAALLPLLEPEMTETDRLVETAKLAGALEKGDLDLAFVVEHILEKGTNADRLLLVIDQFEELYTLCPDEDTRLAFLDLLLVSMNGTDQAPGKAAALTLAITLRADFMSQVLASVPLADTLQDNTLMLGPMTLDGLRDVVEQPALRSGATFETGLAKRLLATSAGRNREIYPC